MVEPRPGTSGPVKTTERSSPEVVKVLSELEINQAMSAKRSLLKELNGQESDQDPTQENREGLKLRLEKGGEEGEWLVGSQVEAREKKKATRKSKEVKEKSKDKKKTITYPETRPSNKREVCKQTKSTPHKKNKKQ